MIEVRHNGALVARFEDHEHKVAAAFVRANFTPDTVPEHAGVSVTPGKPYELHAADTDKETGGFVDSFDSQAEAEAAMELHKSRFPVMEVREAPAIAVVVD